jgi:hypothetical protein
MIQRSRTPRRRLILLAGGLAAALAVPALTAGPARAGMTLEKFRQYAGMPGGAQLVRSYLSGIRDGMIGLQTNLVEQGLEPTFCPVSEDITTGTTFEQTVMREINQPTRGEPWPGDTQLASVVAAALQNAYPCETY